MSDPAIASVRHLRSTGWARYLEATLLLVWLIFWIVGEVVSLVLIGAMLASAVSAALGHPAALASRVAPTDGSVSFFLFFLLLWAALWTVGGVAAAIHLLRMIAGEDVIGVTAGILRLQRRAGPFRRRRDVPLESIRRVRLRPYGREVVLDTRDGTLVVSDLGSAADRVSLKEWLADSLTLPSPDGARLLDRETPPRERDIETNAGETIVTHPTRRARRTGAWIIWALAAIVSLGWIDAVRRSDVSRTTGAEYGAAALTALVAAAAVWVTRARTEWIAGPGTLRIRRSFGGATLSEQSFDVGSTLAIEQYRDSDGDEHYTLVVRGAGRRRVLSRAMKDPYELLALAEWLAGRTAFPFNRPSVL